MTPGPRARLGGWAGGRVAAGGSLLAILLLLTVGAFAGIRLLRAQDDIVNGVRLEPTASPQEPARVRFRLAEADRDVDVLIVSQDGDRVRALALDVPLEREKHTFRWNARNDAGEPVPPGRYRLRLLLGEQDREIEPPGSIRVRRESRPEA